MRRGLTCAVAAAALAGAGCAAPGGLRLEGPVPTATERPAPAYVLDSQADPLQRPASLSVTEFTSVTGMRWTRWGEATAEAAGAIHGSWCLPGCERDGYAGKLVLSRLVKGERASYYSRAALSSDAVPAKDRQYLGEFPMPVPGG